MMMLTREPKTATVGEDDEHWLRGEGDGSAAAAHAHAGCMVSSHVHVSAFMSYTVPNRLAFSAFSA